MGISQPLRLEFLIQGSAEEPYQVIFQKTGKDLRATCTCPAGRVGTYCKHRVNLILGKKLDIAQNEESAHLVPGMVQGTDVAIALESYLTMEKGVEKLLKQIKAEQKFYRDKLSEALNN